MTLGTGTISLVAARRSRRDGACAENTLQGKIVTIFAANNPRDECEELEGGFPSGFPHHVVDLGPPYLIAFIPTACGEHR